MSGYKTADGQSFQDDDRMFREVDRRHVLQLFDLFAESGYDIFELIRAYAETDSRVRADQDEESAEYFILKQPVCVYNEILRSRIPAVCSQPADKIILHWMAELYVFGRHEKHVSFKKMMRLLPPEWLYRHFSPLHEASLENAWDKSCSVAVNARS